ncbi:MAG: chromosomal replication initiator DnaA [Fimbriimonadaceae bacterium]|nr:chromosomal replication initiator DnaA [Alphaproteobacteria bacterium]
MTETDKSESGKTEKQSRQLRIPLAHEAARGREDFIVSPANADAVALIDQWPDWPHPVVALAGPAGSGKSHLAAAWASHTGAATVNAQDIAACDLAALAAGKAVLVEDADRMLASETALFHLFNLVREHDITMVLTARLRPSVWPVSLPDLISRLRAVTVAEIGSPDDRLLAAVLVKLFADRQIQVEKQVIDYLVARMERSMDAAHCLVAALDDEALTIGRGVTKGVARRVLEGFRGDQ